MASFTDRIKILLEIDDMGGVKALTRFRDSIKAAEGATGKFKAAAGGAMDFVKTNAVGMAATAGAVIAAFGVKAVHAFEEVSKAALDLGAATGLAVEDASRWIAVGDDFGVTAESLATGIGRIAKTLDDSKWAEYGISTRDASGAARDANDVLIDALSTLSSISNATERARVGTDLFSKGYKSLAPIVGHTADEYRSMLGAVEDGQVITANEAEKAEKMRLAEDKLSDALKELTLSAGQAVASLAPLIEHVADLISLMQKAGSFLADSPVGNMTDEFWKLAPAVEQAGMSVSDWAEKIWTGKATVEDLKDKLAEAGVEFESLIAPTDKATESTTDLGDSTKFAGLSVEEIAAQLKDSADKAEYYKSRVAAASGKTDDLADSASDASGDINFLGLDISAAAEAVDRLDHAYQVLKGHLDQREAWRNLGKAMADFEATAKDSESSWDDIAAASDDAVQAAADYIEAAEGIPPEVKTKLLTELD